MRAELAEYRPKRPLALRDELRIRRVLARCTTCGACPWVVGALTAMAPPVQAREACDRRPAPTFGIVLKLAS
jgi:hypothetical protein